MQCGKELAEAHERVDGLHDKNEGLLEENRILRLHLEALKAQNLGEKVTDKDS